MTSVILVGVRLADPSTEFVYHGELSICEGCLCRHQCLNLIEDVHYRILDVREDAQVLNCVIHNEGVRAVEVEPAPITASAPSKGAYTGNKASLQNPCPYTECPSHGYCAPEGAEFSREYRIHDVLGDLPHDHCHLGRNLTLVEFEPVDE